MAQIYNHASNSERRREQAQADSVPNKLSAPGARLYLLDALKARHQAAHTCARGRNDASAPILCRCVRPSPPMQRSYCEASSRASSRCRENGIVVASSGDRHCRWLSSAASAWCSNLLLASSLLQKEMANFFSKALYFLCTA